MCLYLLVCPFSGQDVTRTKGNEFEDYFLKRELLMGIFEKVRGGLPASGGEGKVAETPRALAPPPAWLA